MSPSRIARARLLDEPEHSGRTTVNLLASLAARLTTLHYVSGSTAVGSLVAGFAALGREVSRTAEGARLRRAIEAGRAGTTGDALWKALRIDEWASALPPSPVLDHVRNDLALLLADDLDEALEQMPVPPLFGQVAIDPNDLEPATFLDCLLGLWAHSLEIVRAVEALAAPNLESLERVARSDGTAPTPEGPLLR